MAKTKRPPAPPPGLRLEWLDPETLAPNPSNWRRHPETQTTALRAALEEVGWAGALLYNERTKRLIDGHARKEIKKGGLAPVLIGSWTEEQERLILATLDPLAAMASADAVALQALLADVATGDEALAAMLADLAAANPIIDPLPEPGGGGDDFDATPEAGPTRTNVGELWVIGGVHRLLVGDCTVAENVTRLMGGEKAGLMVTDPPYGINHPTDYSDRGRGNLAPCRNYPRVEGDSVPFDPAGLLAFNLPSIIWGGNHFASRLPDSSGWLVWDKERPDDLDQATCELAWTNCVKGVRRFRYLWNGMMRAGSDDLDHPTQKPVALIQWCLELKWVPSGDVFDPFLGSGTTMIAAHRLSRRAYGCELEPRYADVILKRATAEGLSVEKAD